MGPNVIYFYTFSESVNRTTYATLQCKTDMMITLNVFLQVCILKIAFSVLCFLACCQLPNNKRYLLLEIQAIFP